MKIVALVALLGIGHIAEAGVAVMDFDAIPVTGAVTSLPQVYEEDGIKLSGFVNSTTNSLMIHTGTAFDTGHKAVEPAILGTSHGVQIEQSNGKPFDLLSVRLSPKSVNTPATLRATGFKVGGGSVTQNITTGNAVAGTVYQLNSNFTNLQFVQIGLLHPQWDTNRFQIDDITMLRYPMISILVEPMTSESAGSTMVKLQLDGSISTVTNISYAINPGTATTPSDYTLPGGSATGVMSIAANAMQASLSIPIVNNTTSESLEQFTISFSGNPAGTVFAGAASATLRIADMTESPPLMDG